MRGPYQEAKTQPLPAHSVPRPPPVYPRWLIIGSITVFILGSVLFSGIGLLVMIEGNRQSAAYEATAAQWIAHYDAALARFDALVAASHPTDPTWRAAVQEQFTAIKAVGADIRAYHPPFVSTAWHSGMISDVAGNYDEFVRLYAYGLDKDDHGAMYRGLQARQKADRYVTNFLRLVEPKPTPTPSAGGP